MSSPRVRRIAERLLARRRWVLAAVIALTAVLGFQATKVRPDYSIELLFPIWDPARQTYDRFKAAFPHEDTRAVVIAQADDLFTAEGARWLSALERELGKLSGVVEVLGPTTARTPVLAGEGVQLVPLLGDDPSPERLAHARKVLTTDPLFAWNVASPDGKAASIVVRLDPVIAGSDDGRQRLTRELNAVAERHARPGQELIVSGVPPIRATFAAMILQDVNTLVPAALGMVLVLLWVVFRRAGAVLASLATILVSLVWTYGLLGVLGYPLSMMVSILPIIAIIICVSDSVHLVSHFLAARREGLPPKEAVAASLAEGALPCLLTEVVLACGFLSLVAINITAALHFGVAAAITMGLVWVANVTVLPLALSVTRAQVGAATQPPAALRVFDRFAVWIGRQLTAHPRRIVAVAVVVLGAAAFFGTRVSTLSYVFDDMRPGSAIERQIRTAEKVHGGLVPLELFIEATAPGPDAALDPELLRLADRGARMLRELPEVEQANSLVDSLRHAGEALGLGDPLTDPSVTRQQLVRGLSKVPDPALFQDVLSADRRMLAVQARVADCGSACIEALFAKVDAWVAEEQARLDRAPGGPIARVHATGQARIFKDVNDILMRGLLGSFGASLLISLVLSALVLRSWKLGVIAIIPNVAPIVLVVGLMAVTGVALKPVTVVLFSITLVIAEDDTLQLLSRLRAHYARALAASVPGTDPHVTAALSCMREVALPILATSAAVSGGFLLLLFSRFLSVAHLGMLIGGTLFAAVLADLFLTPLLVIWLKPFALQRAEPAVASVAAEVSP